MTTTTPRHGATFPRLETDEQSIGTTPAIRPPNDLGYPSTIDDCLSRFVLVYGRDEIWDTERLIPMKAAHLRLAIGRQTMREWLEHPHRSMVAPDEVVFDPTETCPPHYINLWQGFDTQPQKGDCADILELLTHLLSNVSDNDTERSNCLVWVLRWLALPLQKPGTKMQSALVFHGPQGSGKSLFFDVIKRIYGQYANTIGQQQIESKYTDWLSRKLFAVAEEVASIGEQLHIKNALKHIITGEKLMIESKFQAVREERNSCNLAFLSNENKPLALEADDRRHFVVWVPEARGDDLYQRVAASLQNGGAAAFHEFLLNVSLGDFTAHAKPPLTNAKRDLVELGIKPAERFLRDWLDGELDLPVRVCSTAQLYKAFAVWSRLHGERSVSSQTHFTSSAAKCVKDRMERHKCFPSRGQTGASVTLWLPRGTGPREGVAWYDFAVESVASFASALSRFGGTNGTED